ncbi:MAG: hypothetical protein ACMXYM_00005, partial [Candidatus Woesearchaeota archaeon]
MRTILLVLLVMSLATTVGAVDKDAWGFSGDPIEFQGTTYYVFLDSSRANAYVESNETKLILREGQCRVENFVRYCFIEVANESNSNWFTFDSRNRPLYGARFTFESLGPNLRLTQKYSTTSPDVNARIDGEITVRNTGNRDASNVIITYEIEPGARIHTCSDCTITQRSFTRELTRVRAGETQTVSFSMIVERAEPFSSSAQATFRHETTDGSIGPISQSFSIRKPYEVSLTRPSAVPVGDWVQLRLTVRNTGENTITFDARPESNASLTYESSGTPGYTSHEAIEVEPGETFTYDYRARSTRAGTFTTGHDIVIRRGSETFEEELRSDLTWRLQDVRLTARLSKERVTPGDTNTLYVGIENRGTISFTNLDVSYTGIISDERRIDGLRAGQRRDVFDASFTHQEPVGTYAINTTLRYDTQFGEEQTATVRVPYTVIPLNETYLLRRVIQPSTPEIGEEFTVTVYGRRTTDSGVRYSEIRDRLIGARVIRGTHRTVPVISNDETRIYQYEAVREDERFALITSIQATFENEQATITDIHATFNLTEENIEDAITSPETSVTIETDEEPEEPLEEDTAEEP